MLQYKDSSPWASPADAHLIDLHTTPSPPSNALDDTTPPDSESHQVPSPTMLAQPNSPQRTKKPAGHQGGPGAPHSNSPQREQTPSPSRTRPLKTHSMPIPPIPPFHGQQQQQQYHQQSQAQASPTSATFSHQQASPSGSYKTSYTNEVDHEYRPSLVQSYSHPSVQAQTMAEPRPIPYTAVTTPAFLTTTSHPRSSLEDLQIVDEAFMAQVDWAADAGKQIHPIMLNMNGGPGMSGVAYAGGVTSSGRGYVRSDAVHPVIERVRGGAEAMGPRANASNRAHRTSPRESLDLGAGQRTAQPQPQVQQVQVQSRDSPKRAERLQQQRAASPLAKVHYPDDSDSPPYEPVSLPIATMNTNVNIAPKRRSLGASPPSQAARATPTAKLASASQTSLTPPASNRTPDRDRSLPVQEEVEDETITPANAPMHAQVQRERSRTITAADYGREHEYMRGSPTPSSDTHPGDLPGPGATSSSSSGTGPIQAARPPLVDSEDENAGRTSRAAHRMDDDDETLIEQRSKDGDSRSASESEEARTPRSPVHQLPEQFAHFSTAQLAALQGLHGGGLGYGGMNNGINAAVNGNGMRRTRTGLMDYAHTTPLDAMLQQYAALQGQGQEYFTAPQPGDYSFFDEELYRAYQPSPVVQNQNQNHRNGMHQAHPHAHGHMHALPPHLRGEQHGALGAHGGNTAAPSPSPLISGMGSDGGGGHLPPFSPVQPGGTPGPYPPPFSHMRRNLFVPQAHPVPQPATNMVRMISSTLNGDLPPEYAHGGESDGAFPMSNNYMADPALSQHAIRLQLQRQLQQYGINQLGGMSDSTLSPNPSPAPSGAASYNPWRIMERGPRARMMEAASFAGSMQSTPNTSNSELPPFVPVRRARKKIGASKLGDAGSGGGGGGRRKEMPPRVDSTQPRETSPELSSGEETAGESVVAGQQLAVITSEEAEWVDEDEEEEEDLLDLEFHTSYVSNAEKRRRRFDAKWEALVQAFQALDRQTDATMVLLAAPAHSSKVHALSSRSLRRDRALFNSPAFQTIRASFRDITARRKAARLQSISLMERLAVLRDSNEPGSPGSSSTGSREEDLRRALGAALQSLNALKHIYDQREDRWRDEWNVLVDEREGVHMLLSQALGKEALAQAAARAE